MQSPIAEIVELELRRYSSTTMPLSHSRPHSRANASSATTPIPTTTRSALKASPSVRMTVSACSRPLIAATPTPRRKCAPKATVLSQEKIRHDRRDRPAHRARDLDHRRLGPEARSGRRDFEPDESGADDDDLGLGAKALADRGRIGDVAEREHARQIDSGRLEPPLPRASGEDEMPVIDRAAVAELHPLRRAINPRCADAEPEVDALLAEMRIGPQREPMDVHFALEKRLGQRRTLIGRILLGGEKNDLAVKPLLAQGRRGLNSGMAGADDDDRGQGWPEIAEFIHPAHFIHWRRARSGAVSSPAPEGLGRRAPSMRDR